MILHVFTVESEIIEHFDDTSIVITGDFNLIQNHMIDTSNYCNINNPQTKEKTLKLMEIYNLTDPFRGLYPELEGYDDTIIH